jgi:hypothetical protein
MKRVHRGALLSVGVRQCSRIPADHDYEDLTPALLCCAMDIRPGHRRVFVRVAVGTAVALLLGGAWWLFFAPAPETVVFAGDIKPETPADYLFTLKRKVAPVRPPAAGTPVATVRPAPTVPATLIATVTRPPATATPAPPTATGAPGALAATSTLGPTTTSVGGPGSPVGGLAATSTLGPTNTPRG